MIDCSIHFTPTVSVKRCAFEYVSKNPIECMHDISRLKFIICVISRSIILSNNSSFTNLILFFFFHFQAGQYDSHYQVKTKLLEESMNRHKRNPCSSFCTRVFHRIRANFLLFLITLGIVIGFAIGILVHGHVSRIKDPEEKATFLMLLGFPGELLMNMLKLLVTPLIIASLICALASVDSKATSRIARRTLVYYITTTILAVILGIVLVVSIRPGRGQSDTSGRLRNPPQNYRTLDAYLDLVR